MLGKFYVSHWEKCNFPFFSPQSRFMSLQPASKRNYPFSFLVDYTAFFRLP